MKKFIEYSKKEKIFRIANYCFTLLMVLFSIIFACLAFYNKGSDAGIRCLGPIFHILLIYIIEAIFRYRVSNFVLYFYNIYVFFAAFLGTTLDFYNFTYYDDIMHTIFGYVGCIIGLYFLVKFDDYSKMKTSFIMLSVMFVAMGCAGLWEFTEFFCDKVFLTTSHGAPINGIVPVYDTMNDILVSFYGMLVFELQFIIHRLTKKNLLIDSIVSDFSKN